MTNNLSDTDQRFIAEVLPVFISEAREQIQAIEQLLLQLEENPADRELLDALFRCAHTVKGSAGIFGLDKVVGFTHHVETILDRLRDGAMALTPALSTLLLQCNDQILHLVDSAADDTADTPDHIGARADLIAQLQVAMGEVSSAAIDSPPTVADPIAEQSADAQTWLISVRFGRDCFRNGTDPLAVMQYLSCFGTVTAISCAPAQIPKLDVIDPESCYLCFEMQFSTLALRAEIETAFSFFEDNCELRLIAPASPIDHYIRLIDAMPDRPYVGEILVEIGAITSEQLDAALRIQRHAQLEPGIEPPLIGDVLQQQVGLAAEVVVAALDKQHKQHKRDSAPVADEQRYIRVQADRLDEVINLLGELVTAGAGAALMAAQTRNRSLSEVHQHMGRLIEGVRNGTLQLRMVPIGETFNRFRRVVRDTAANLGKQVALEIVGAEAEMDKSVVEKIADPLMHLVRNGLDHGLEAPAERLAAGKPAQGTLILSARHESGGILIRIQDDGRGIDRERVLRRAWERGLVEQGLVPADADILKLIFAPGFSTAETITNLSGRGVGMDVVSKNIAALRGTVSVHSEFGVGTTIDIRLPLTLAIIDGFLIAVGNSKFIIPLEAVIEVIAGQRRPGATDARGRYCLELRGEVLPVVSLRRLYGLDSKAPERVSVIVLGAGAARFGVEVDTLLGQHQTVIKPLGHLFRALRGISGSSILGNGEVALIFDVSSLCELAAIDSNSNTSHSIPPISSPPLSAFV